MRGLWSEALVLSLLGLCFCQDDIARDDASSPPEIRSLDMRSTFVKDWIVNDLETAERQKQIFNKWFKFYSYRSNKSIENSSFLRDWIVNDLESGERRTQIFNKWFKFPWHSSNKSIDGRIAALQNSNLYDGDMIGIDGPNALERMSSPETVYRWSGGVVPYVIDSSLAGDTKIIYDAMRHYHRYTCVRFVPRKNERDYVKIYAGEGCNSAVGHTGDEQTLSLGDRCLYIGTVIHELGHTLGFYHEQGRYDRDDYLNIYLDNVQKGKERNFRKLNPKQNILYTKFDYTSVMIYGNTAFSKDGESITMAAKTGQKLYDPYKKKTMSWSDIKRVNRMYKCHNKKRVSKKYL